MGTAKKQLFPIFFCQKNSKLLHLYKTKKEILNIFVDIFKKVKYNDKDVCKEK